ncbi:uncharacterized protein LOC107040607 [Diachasma alloeum]|uniref:uncharacterized protein LOC107040607 n=1 Tax=Diachasma alloeum TaxID=454923 RepID=UPI0007381B64|nr:uncharacterized protein LOC107040607 [Diachasma alloeum]
MSRDKEYENGVSKLVKLSPKLLEGVDNVENIWETMRERFPQTASLLCDMERVMKRAEHALRYREIEAQISMTDSESESSDKLDSPDNDFESLNEWSQVVNDSFPEDSDLTPSPHPTETVDPAGTVNDLEASDELIELNKLSIIQKFDVPREIYNRTISTISCIKLIENKVPVLEPSITTKEAVLAPVQPRISSYEDKPRKNDNDRSPLPSRALSPHKKRPSNLSPLRSVSLDIDKPSHIPVRSPRQPVSPRGKDTSPKKPRSPNAKSKLPTSPPPFNKFASNNSCNRIFQKSATRAPF